MGDSVVSLHFGATQAATYDERTQAMKPLRETLDFLTRTILSPLPENSRILCVGSGTGVELIDLALAFPSWRFTAAEPSVAMSDVCRRKADDAGVSSRIEFHDGYLESLADTEPFDAAASILVSHFLTDSDKRVDYFRQIAKRLRPGACLINADIATTLTSPDFERLFIVWLQSHGMNVTSIDPSNAGWGKDVAVSTPIEIESILTMAGFEQPIQFYQCLFIHAWYARLPFSA